MRALSLFSVRQNGRQQQLILWNSFDARGLTNNAVLFDSISGKDFPHSSDGLVIKGRVAGSKGSMAGNRHPLLRTR